MPWSSSQDQKPNNDDDQSLTTVLRSHEDRTNLLLLVANCTESMRKQCSDTFDPRASEQLVNPGTSELISTATEEETESKRSITVGSQGAAEGERREALVQELSSKQTQQLKRAALQYLDDWRARVIERVGEAVNQKDEAPEHEQAATAEPKVPLTPAEKLEPSTKDQAAITAFRKLYPPQETPLRDLDGAQRTLILHSLLLLLLSLENYSAESRVLLLQLTSSLDLPLETLTDDEAKVARGLLEAAKKQMSADEETKKKAEDNASSRKWKVGLGAVGGAALIGITGGLAAPLLAAGVGSVMGGLGLGATAAAGYLGALAGSAPLVGVLFGAYGGRMTGQMIDVYAKEVSDFAFIPAREHQAQTSTEARSERRLRVAIGISGWLTDQRDVVDPWRVIGPGAEAFALRFELEAMLGLGNALVTYVKSAAWGWAKKEIISRTVFGALTAGLWPLGLLRVSRIVDNPFSVARARSEKAGAVLADALINHVQGERPVTLVGYSLGARAIYTCLTTLAERRAFGLIENVVLVGAPAPSDAGVWRAMRSVVAGRLVNVYSTNDYLLGFLYRTTSLQLGIAGLQAVEGVAGVENIDVSDLVDSHTKYRYLTGVILKKIGFEDVDVEEVAKEEVALSLEEKKEESEREKNEEMTGGEGEDAEKLEQEVKRKNEQSMMGWMSSKVGSLGFGGGGQSAAKAMPAAGKGVGAVAKNEAGGAAGEAQKSEGSMSEQEKLARAEDAAARTDV